MADIKVSIASPVIEEEEINAVIDVMKSGMIAQGPKVIEFEEEFAKYVGAKYGIATNSGTSALHVALLAAGIGLGDEVITTPFTFAATGNSILYTGARPVFVDIDPDRVDHLLTVRIAFLKGSISPNDTLVYQIQNGQGAGLLTMHIGYLHDIRYKVFHEDVYGIRFFPVCQIVLTFFSRQSFHFLHVLQKSQDVVV